MVDGRSRLGVPSGDGFGEVPHETVEGTAEVLAAGVGESGPAEAAGGLDGDGGGAGYREFVLSGQITLNSTSNIGGNDSNNINC